MQPEQQWQEWCARRDAMVAAVPGNLALVGYQPVGEQAEELEDVPGIRVRREGDQQAVVVEVSEGTDAALDGQPVHGEVELARLRADGTPVLRIGRHHLDAFSLDGTDFEVRVYDEQAENLAEFQGIERYPYDPAMVCRGRFVPHESVDAVAWQFTRQADSGHTKQVPGSFFVEVGGSERELVAFQDGGELVVVFSDATTGESYAPGRFLRVPLPAGEGSFEVDFNRAFVPPCGFSDFYSCPVPPAPNRLDVPVAAGEKRVTWRTPRH